jgi:putative membrane protein
MKKSFSFITRAGVSAVAAGTLCFAGQVFAQENGPSSATSSTSAANMESNTPAQTKVTTSGSPAAASATTKSSRTSAQSTTTASLDRKDRDFMMTAAKGGMMEVHMGQMAQQMGQSADVKRIGARMVADHTKTNNELMTLATAKGVKLDTRHKMSKMDNANFDQQYLAEMLKDHQKDIAEFQREAQNGMDPDVKRFAAKTLPTLQQHLQMVQTASGKAPTKKG